MNTITTNTIGFVETLSNDGSAKGDVIYTLPDGERFSSGLSGEDLNGYFGVEVVKGVPKGMTASLIVNDDLASATLILEGMAIEHAQANSGKLTISFTPDLATYFDSLVIPADFIVPVSFNDSSSVTFVNTLKESAANDGSVTGSIVFTLNQAEFNADIDVTKLVDSVPEGLIPELEISENGKNATLTFIGNAFKHDVDVNFNIDFTSSDLKIDFISPRLILSDEFTRDGLNFDSGWEGSDNKKISTILTLEDATFIRKDLDLTKFVSNVPEGITVVLKTISATETELTLIAENVTTFDSSEIQINLPREVFSNRMAIENNTKIALTNYDTTAPDTPTVTIDSGNNDTIITSQERANGLTISGISEPGSTITLMFGIAATTSNTEIVALLSTSTVTVNSTGEWSYTLTKADMITGNGSQLIQALAVDAAGNSSEPATIELNFVTSNHSPTGNVTISGEAQQGKTLTVSNTLADADGLGVISYQWLADDEILPNANQTTYNLTQADVGKNLSVSASYTDGFGQFETVTSESVEIANLNDKPTGKIDIKGAAKVGQTLSVTNTLKDSDGLGEFSYQWFSNKSEIIDATAATYTLSKFDAGKKISVEISYTDGEGTLESLTSSTTATIKPANNGVIKIGDDKNNKLQGATKNDDLEGLAGDDVLFGKAGNDTLNGGDGNDSLTGDAGFDVLIGGKGADVFIFTNIKDAPVSRSGIDVITDFNSKEGDKIDLSKIDADATKSKDQAFSKPTVGEKFSGKFANIGDLFFETSTGILYGNVNKDGAADFAIKLSGVTTLTVNDFVL